MSYVSAEVKLRTLAINNPTISGYIGTRWLTPRQLPGYINQGTCIRAFRVSTERFYAQTGIVSMSKPRFQIDVLDFDNERALEVAAAVVDFLGTVSLAQNNQFDSPVTTPPQFPNFVSGPRQGMEAQTDASGNPLASKGPVMVQSIDVRLYNLES